MVKPLIYASDIKSPEILMEEMRKKNEALAYLSASVLISKQISDWLKKNIKDGDSIDKLYDPEPMFLYEEDQKLYLKIKEIDPQCANSFTEPMVMHQIIVDTARGKYSKTH